MTPLSSSWAEHRAVLAAHQPFRDLECRRVAPDGTIRYLSVSGAPIFDEQGRFQGYQGVGRNITERKRIEEELRSRQEMLALAQQSARAVAFEWRIGDPVEGSTWPACVRVSDGAKALFGVAPGSFDGSYESWKKLVHPDDWPRCRQAIKIASETGERRRRNTAWCSPGAASRWLHAKGRMLLRRRGQAGAASRFRCTT